MTEPYLETGSAPRVYRYTADGKFVDVKPVATGSTQAGFAIDPSGDYGFVARGKQAGRVALPGFGGFGSSSGEIISDENAKSTVTSLAVDSSTGDLYVGKANGEIELFSFNASLDVVEQGGSLCTPGGGNGDFGCDSTETFNPGLGPVTSLAVDPANHHLFAGLGSRVVELDDEGEQVGTGFGDGTLKGNTSAAFHVGSDAVYESDKGGGISGTVRRFTPKPTVFRPIDNPAIVNAVSDSDTHRYSDIQTSSDGRFVAFASDLSLTGFLNLGHELIYRYDADSQTLDCASCAPSGATPQTDTSLSSYGLNLSDDGRLFFTSRDPYVLRDTNRAQDAYEWSDGKVDLLSTGQSPEGSEILTVTRDGKDAFFFTRETLSAEDENGSAVKVYTAREGGGVLSSLSPYPCAASDECHGPGTKAPSEPVINTVTGAGTSLQVTKPPQCKKGKVRRKGRCVKRRRNRKVHGRGNRHKKGQR
jgi:hypothetical protein